MLETMESILSSLIINLSTKDLIKLSDDLNFMTSSLLEDFILSLLKLISSIRELSIEFLILSSVQAISDADDLAFRHILFT